MKVIEFNGKKLKIVEEIMDEKYGRIWDAYYDHKKVYIIDGKIVEEQVIIDYLDNKYGIPVSKRGVFYNN